MAAELEPTRVRQHGVSAVASAAGVVGGLVLLVALALPSATAPVRTGIPTGPTDSSAAVPTQPALPVVTADQFAAEHASGRFDGSTVLVRGEIKPGRAASVPGCYDQGRCYAGVLAGETLVSVGIPYVAGREEDGGVLLHDDQAAWPWWQVLSAAQSGVLMLSVSADGAVMFGGAVIGAEERTVADLDIMDLESVALNDVVVTSAWLSPPVPMFGCSRRYPFAPDIAGLPSRGCGTDRLHETETGDASLAVQVGAYDSFAAELNSESAELRQPVFGRYALARRLFGAGCTGVAPPCWGWRVVARIADAEQLAAAPTRAPTDSAASPHPEPTFSQANSDRGHDFELTLSVAGTDHVAGEPIKLDATLEYTGAAEQVTITGDSELFAFAFDQLDGGLEMRPVSRLMCGSFELRPHEPVAQTYGYGGLYLLEGEPVDIDRLFPDVSGLRLPAGTYRLSVAAGFVVGAECYSFDDYQVLQTSIVIRVR